MNFIRRNHESPTSQNENERRRREVCDMTEQYGISPMSKDKFQVSKSFDYLTKFDWVFASALEKIVVGGSILWTIISILLFVWHLIQR